MNRAVVGLLRNSNRLLKKLFLRAFNIELKYPGGFPPMTTHIA